MSTTFSQYLREEQFFPSTMEELHHELNKMQLMGRGFSLKDLHINTDLTVNWDGNLDLARNQYIRTLGRIPVKFRTVSGEFDCSGMDLTTLEGCPDNCGGFRADNNLFARLIGGPARVRGNYSVENNSSLLSLEGIASYIDGDLKAANCYGILSLHNIHKRIQTLNGSITFSSSLVAKTPYCINHALGLLLIDGLERIDPSPIKGSSEFNKFWSIIINKFLPNKDGKNAVIECQNALLDAGFDKVAEL